MIVSHKTVRGVMIALVIGLTACAGEAVRYPYPVVAAPTSGPAILPTLPLVHRFVVGKTNNDIALIASSHVLVVAQSAGGRALVMDEASGRRLALIHLFSEARHVAVDPALSQIYLPDEFSGRLLVARYRRGWAHLTTASVALGPRPHGVDVDPQTHRIYVTNEHGASVSIVAGASLVPRATVHVGRVPGGIGVARQAGLVYVALVAENRVVVLRAVTGTVLRSIPVGKGPTHLAVDQTTGRAAVVNTADGTLSIVDGRRGTAAPPVPVGIQPYNVVADGADGLIFVASVAAPTVTVVDGRRDVVRGTLRLDLMPGALAIDPGRRWLIVGGANRPWVEVFSYRAL